MPCGSHPSGALPRMLQVPSAPESPGQDGQQGPPACCHRTFPDRAQSRYGGGGAGHGAGTTKAAGTANTGGGGGGGGTGSLHGMTGGSGVVILKILASDYSGIVTGSPNVANSGDYKILTYNGSGTYTTTR